MSDTPVAIVTGGANGLGAAICIELLKECYQVCVADVQVQKGKDFVEEQQKVFGADKIIFSYCDVQKESDYKSTFDLTLATFHKVDVLINNAGINREHDPLKLLSVNLLGPIIGCQTALKYMGKSSGKRGGIVINTSSALGFLPASSMPVYTASKHGIIGLTRSYGHPSHLQKDGVVFAALCPFLIDTDMLASFQRNALYSDQEPPKRFDVMSPEYVAKGVMKILEDKINGSALLVTPEVYQYVGYPDELKNIPL